MRSRPALGHLHVGHVLLDGMRFRDGPRDRFRLRVHESRQRRTWDAVMVIEMAPVVDRMLALWNGQPVEPSTVYSRRCVENGGEDVFDPEDVLPRIGMLRGAAPDLHFDVADAFLAGRRNVVRLRASGTLNGSLITSIGTVLGTDRPFEMTGIEVFDIAEDLIVAVWTSWDWGRLYASLGVRA
jgi:hypothetical protein